MSFYGPIEKINVTLDDLNAIAREVALERKATLITEVVLEDMDHADLWKAKQLMLDTRFKEAEDLLVNKKDGCMWYALSI